METSPKYLHPRSHSKMSGSKYKKIMTHVSKFLHGTTSSTSAQKRSGKKLSKVSEPSEIETRVHNEEQSSSASVKEERSCEPDYLTLSKSALLQHCGAQLMNQHADVRKLYSTIKEVTAVVHEPAHSSDFSNKTPPLPKNIEELYAKVKKKKSKKTAESYIPSIPLENIPGTSGLPSSTLVHQPDINYNIAENTASKEVQGTELQPCENVPGTETHIDELQTWNFLVRHQLQLTKQPSRVKLNHCRRFDDSYKVGNRVQKHVALLKKGVVPNEGCCHHSQPNFPMPSEKPVRYTHYRSLEDFSSLAAHKEDTVNKIWQECQEEMMKFQQNMEQVVEENKVLHQQIHSLLQKEAKWKEEKESLLIHKQDNHLLTQKNNILLQELTALHEQKGKEVKHLSYQVQRLQAEKNDLLEKLHSTLHEKETLEDKYSKMCERNAETVSYAVHAQAIGENQRLFNDMRKKHQEDMDRILESCRDIENEKNNLSVQVQILKDDVKKLHQNNASLKNSLEEALKTKSLTLSQLKQSKQQCFEVQDLLISLLKLAEEATTERDIALTKAEFQEKQQTQIQGTVIEHSIGIGRLQEHIGNIRKRVNEEIRDIEMSFR